MVRSEANKRLQEMKQMLPVGHHDTAQDFDKPIRAFIDIYQSGDRQSLHPDLIREWALENGWDEERAQQLGVMADTVDRTMRILSH